MDQRALILVCVREGAAACHVNAQGAGWWCATERGGSAHFLKLELFFMWLRHAVKPVSTAPQPAQVNTAVFDLGSVSPSRLSRAQLPRSLRPLLLVGALLPPRLAVTADVRSFFLMPLPATPSSAAASFAFFTLSSGMVGRFWGRGGSLRVPAPTESLLRLVPQNSYFLKRALAFLTGRLRGLGLA